MAKSDQETLVQRYKPRRNEEHEENQKRSVPNHSSRSSFLRGLYQSLLFRIRPTQDKYRSLAVHCGLVLFIGMPSIYSDVPREPHPYEAAQDNQQTRRLEPGKPIERELAADASHSYQIALDAGQYANLVVDQRGVNVVVQLSGPDGEQIMEFDSESRPQGKESLSFVAEAAGSYRLIVRPKQKKVPEGSYEIRIEKLRAATVDDRDLWQARKLVAEGVRLYGAGKYDEARPLFERAIEIRERVLGADHLEVAYSLNDLGVTYYTKGAYAKAGPLFQRAFEIKEKTLGPEHPEVASALNNLAIFYFHSSDYSRAESLFERALAMTEKALGPDHPDVAKASNNLALVYYERGDELKAEPLYRRALSIWEKALGPEHPKVSYALLSLAKLYQDKGDYAEAEPLLRRALTNDEKSLGPDHPDVAFILNNLAALHYDKGEYAKAEPLSQRALILREKALGPESLDVARSLCSLARVCSARGDYAKAESLFLRALRIRENALGPEHPDVAWSLNYLTSLYAGKGDIAEAVTFLSRTNAVRERNLALNLGVGSERQKLAYLTLFSKETDFTLSLHSRASPNDPQSLHLAFTTLLRRKGRVLDAMADIIGALRRNSTPQDQKLFDQLVEARSQLATRTLEESGAATPDAYTTRLKPLEEKVERLEAELSARSERFRAQTQPVTLAAVQAALPADGALVEFAFYTPIEPRTEKSDPPRYIAYLLASKGQPKWVDLGEAAVIDRAVDAWRKALRNPNRTDIKRLARAVDDKVMRPVRPLLGKTSRLLIAPDGSLNLIPFAALVDEQNRYLIERYTISYLASGRDLLRLQISQPSENAPMIVANPAFGRAETVVAQATRSAGALQYRSQGRTQGASTKIYFQPLPSTGREALAIKSLLPEASVLVREQATEAAIKRARAPRILHVATHGFFLSDQEAPPTETRGAFGDDPLRASDSRFSKWAANIENPLLRSGLALAGANQGKSGDDDGLLTALEVAGLDLWGTKLVALSACDTGVGEVKNGEGVQGLRRALVLAGSESQVMSLWPVLDNTAMDLMIPYYEALRQGKGRSDGLRQAQLQMLRSREHRHPFYWAAFIQSGEWANLDGQR
jgi:CHAT domain-containing protein/Tfp pilus assembly protein PilF